MELEQNCAKTVLKMVLEARAAGIRENLESRKHLGIYYTDPMKYVSSLLNKIGNVRSREEKSAITIQIYRYLVNEFSGRYQGWAYSRLRDVFVVKHYDLMDEGMDEVLMEYFIACLPRRAAASYTHAN